MFFSANGLFIVFDLFMGESKKWLEYVTATCSRSTTASFNMVWLYNAHAFEWQRYVVKIHSVFSNKNFLIETRKLSRFRST